MNIGFKENHILLSVPLTGDIRTTKSILTYYTEIFKSQLLLVPEDTETDLGSIPQMFQNVFPKDGKAMFAYILHDYLYKTGLFTRKESDDILEEAMKSLGVSWWRRKAVREGLRVGGWVAWNKYRKGLECSK